MRIPETLKPHFNPHEVIRKFTGPATIKMRDRCSKAGGQKKMQIIHGTFWGIYDTHLHYWRTANALENPSAWTRSTPRRAGYKCYATAKRAYIKMLTQRAYRIDVTH